MLEDDSPESETVGEATADERDRPNDTITTDDDDVMQMDVDDENDENTRGECEGISRARAGM